MALPAIWLPGLRTVVGGALLALLILLIVDLVLTVSPGRIQVSRELPSRAGLSEDFERRLRLSGPGGTEVVVFEEAPATCGVHARTVDGRAVDPALGDPTGGPDGGRLDGRGQLVLDRVYRAARRGRVVFGRLRVRVTGPLGLVARQARREGEDALRIEPALAGLRNALRLAASERWRDLGLRRTRRRGGLTEFESLRDYVPGDEPRWIDWKAFARRGRPTVRSYEEERGQELLLVVDAGRRMGATSAEGDERGWSKLDHALDAALELAAVALDKGDRVGIAVFASDLRAYVGPGRGALQLGRLTEAVFDLQASRRESDLEGVLRAISVRQRRRATLILFSDVADPLSVEGQRRALGVGARHHRVIFAGLDDPSVRRVAEGLRPEPPAVRAAAYELVAEREAGLTELTRAGVQVIDALPAEAAAPVLAAWLEARRA